MGAMGDRIWALSKQKTKCVQTVPSDPGCASPATHVSQREMVLHAVFTHFLRRDLFRVRKADVDRSRIASCDCVSKEEDRNKR